jgi:hypothetical protein
MKDTRRHDYVLEFVLDRRTVAGTACPDEPVHSL